MRNSNAHPTVRLKYLPWLLVFSACPITVYAQTAALPGQYWNGKMALSDLLSVLWLVTVQFEVSAGTCPANSYNANGCFPCPANTWSNENDAGCTPSPDTIITPGVDFPPALMSGPNVTISGERFISSASSVSSTVPTALFGAFANTRYASSNNVCYHTSGASTGMWTGTCTQSTIVDGVSYHGEWVQLQTSTPRFLRSYQIETDTFHLWNPRRWIVAGSNDGSSWTQLDSRNGMPWSVSHPNTITSFVTPLIFREFTFFRLILLENGGGPMVSFRRWTLSSGNLVKCPAFTYPTGNSTACAASAPVGEFFSSTRQRFITCPADLFCTGGTALPRACSVCVGETIAQVECTASTNRVCVPCAAGFHFIASNRTCAACLPCPFGSYPIASSGCNSATLPTCGPLPGMHLNGSAYHPCPVGWFCRGGTSPPQRCASGLNSPVGSTFCNASYPLQALVTSPHSQSVISVNLDGTNITRLVSSQSELWNVGGLDLSRSGNLILVAAFDQRCIFAMYPPVYSLILMSGARGVSGSIVGTATETRFVRPTDVKIHPSGEYALVIDSDDCTVRRLFMNGSTTRFAGTSGVPGYLEGTGTNSRFDGLNAIAFAPSGRFALVTEAVGHRIRRLDLTGPLPVSTLLAGSTTPTAGFAEGFGSSARFNVPRGIVVSPDETYALVCEVFNHGRIRRITLATQQVSTLVTMSGLISGSHLTWHPAMDSVIVTGSVDVLRRIRVPHGNQTDFAGWTTQLGSTVGIAITRCLITGYGIVGHACAQCPPNTFSNGTGACMACPANTFSIVGSSSCGVLAPPGFFVSGGFIPCPANSFCIGGNDTARACTVCAGGTHRTRSCTVTMDSECTPCPGGTFCSDGISAPRPCPNGLNSPPGSSACRATYDVYSMVANLVGRTIRSVNAGSSATNTSIPSTAGLLGPRDVAISSDGGFVLVADGIRHVIWMARAPMYVPFILTGNTAGAGIAYSTGPRGNASFRLPTSVKLAPDDSYALVVDSSAHVISQLFMNGTVLTFAGTANTPGYRDGPCTTAFFNRPNFVAISASNAFAIVSEFAGNRIRMLSLSGNTCSASLLAGNTLNLTSPTPDGIGPNAFFDRPGQIAISSDETLVFVAEAARSIRQITIATGQVTTLHTSTTELYGLAVGSFMDYILFSAMDNRIYKMDYPSGVVSVFAGTGQAMEFDSATGSLARFSAPYGMDTWSCKLQGYALSTSSTCIICPPSSFVNVNGKCLPCPEATYSAIGSLSCSATPPAGQFFSPEINGFSRCPENSYCTGEAAPARPCSNCTAGTLFTANCTATSDTVCSPCPPRFLCPSPFSEPQPCTVCPKGFYDAPSCNATADATCQECHAGSYCLGDGAPMARCNTCAVGTRRTAVCTTSSDTVCAACPAGLFCPGGASAARSCLVCAAGTYRLSVCNASADTVCLPCPARTYSQPNSTSCSSSAPPGQFIDSATNGFATCPANSFCSGGVEQPMPCSTCGEGTNTTQACSATGDTACVSHPTALLVADDLCRVRRIDPRNWHVTTVVGPNPLGHPNAGLTCTVIPLPGNRNILISMLFGIYNVSLPSGAYSLMAGSTSSTEFGLADGVGTAARFTTITNARLSPDGTYLLLGTHGGIRRMFLENRSVTTLTSTAGGYAEGSGTDIRLSFFPSVDIHPSGRFAVFADFNTMTIRRLDLTVDPVVSSRLAGRFNVQGSADGDALTVASFNNPTDAAFYQNGNAVLVYDDTNRAIRSIDLRTQIVSTLRTSVSTSSGVFLYPVPGTSHALINTRRAVYRLDLITNAFTLVAGNESRSNVTDGIGAAALFLFAARGGLTACARGFGYNSNGSCSLCPANTFSIGFHPCTVCSNGTHAPSSGLSACLPCAPCPAGFYPASSNNCDAFTPPTCLPCPSGFFCTPAHPEPQPCLPCSGGSVSTCSATGNPDRSLTTPAVPALNAATVTVRGVVFTASASSFHSGLNQQGVLYEADPYKAFSGIPGTSSK
jgi:hypothetical protein